GLHQVAGVGSKGVAGDAREAAWDFGQAGGVARAAELLGAHLTALIRSGQALAAADLAGELLARERQAGGERVVDVLLLRGDLLINTVRAGEAEAAYREAHA